jgi:3-oxoacyl-[acyl-carrier protein] reductase
MDLGLTGRQAIVTGASRGIGKQIAIDLAGEGCDVVLCARRADALAEVAKHIEALGRRATPVAVDLTAAGAAGDVVAEALRVGGRVDILVNNVGGNAPHKLLDVTDDHWQAEFDLNFFSAVRMTRACIPPMRAAGWGRIVSIASTYARQPDPWFGPYSAAKAALINFSANVSRAFAAEGVLSNCVIAGVTLTELVADTAAGAAKASGTTPEDVMNRLMAKDPITVGRFGEPREIAAAVVFLSSVQAGWITGSCVTVDGGTIRVVP